MRVLVFATLVSLATLVLAGCATTVGTSPKGLEIPIEKAAVKFSSDVKAGGYQIVTTDELKQWLDEGRKVTVISTLLPEDDQTMGRIASALNGAMPKSEKELTPAQVERLLQVAGNDKEQPLVLYCGFVGCRRSHIGAAVLVQNGFKNVYRYPAGVAGWREAGYPVTR